MSSLSPDGNITEIAVPTGNSSVNNHQLSLLLRELTAVHHRAAPDSNRPHTVVSPSNLDGSILSPTTPDGVVLRDADAVNGGNSDGLDGDFDPVAYVIKQVLKMGQENLFSEILSAYISRKESEIDRICANHYLDFVDSMDHVIGLRTETGALREQTKQLDDELLDIGLKTMNRGKAVLRHKRILLNIEQTSNVLKKLEHISYIFKKINEHISYRKYYSALKLLEECTDVHLRATNIPQLTIVKQFKSRIPLIQNSIRLSVLEDMKHWQDSLKEETERVGILSLEYTRKKNEELAKLSKDGTNTAIQKLIAISSSNMNLGLLINKDDEDRIIDSQQGSPIGSTADLKDNMDGTGSGPLDIKIDFKPLYQCVHIHDVLGKRNEFAQRYEEGRRVQAGLILNQKIDLTNRDLALFKKYLENIAGFFIIEGVVLNSTQNFRSAHGVETLWSNATSRLNDIINESLQNCDNPGVFGDIKVNVEEFIQTMDSYGYDISALHNLLTFILNRYSSLMKEITETKLNHIIEEDTYSPMMVDTQDEFNHLMKGIYLKDEARKSKLKHVIEWADSLRFPKPVPFTKGFSESCNAIREFIQRCYEFSGGFINRSLKADEYIHECVESLLSKNIAEPLCTKFQVNSISQVVQVLVNVDFYLNVIPELEKYLSSKLPNNRNIDVHLNEAVESFKITRALNEKKAYELINGKIDDFLEVADYDWSSTHHQKEASPFLQDLENFLNGAIVSSLIGVPSSTKNDVYVSVFNHLTRSLLGLMLTPEVTEISIISVQNFKTDVSVVEKMALGMGLDSIKVNNIFLELHQTIQYLLSNNYEEIVTLSVKSKKYPNVKMNKLIAILEKLKNGTLSTSFSLSGTSDEKQKKKDIETAIKNIRQEYDI